MGCLNSNQNFDHWFGNIHLSGPCNRSCYFCIGQHMMALDPLNNLNRFPLDNLDKFVEHCHRRGVTEINVTGTNTDPLMYEYQPELKAYLAKHIPGLTLGLRTNGALITKRWDLWELYDKASITICSLQPDVYRSMMGQGSPPDIATILAATKKPIKINIVLGPGNVHNYDILDTIDRLGDMGVRIINMREPYGQPHVGNPLESLRPIGFVHGMPCYERAGATVTYWDVHYVEVESVNLYANGVVSETYPITKGHCPTTGKVLSQDNFRNSGRVREQWLNILR